MQDGFCNFSLTFAASLKDGVKLTVYQHVGIPADWRGEVCVKRD